MIHARLDYQRIQDPEKKIGTNEPVFLMRAQDDLFVPILLMYAALAQMQCDKSQKGRIVNTLLKHVERAKDWRQHNKCKLPDMPYTAVRSVG